MVKRLFKIVLCVGIAAIVITIVGHFGLFRHVGKATIDASTMLADTLDIAELSTAEFKYKGIAEIYSDEENPEVICRVCYNAVVKAGIDLNNVQFDVDNDNKVVNAILPDIKLNVTIIDEQSMTLLPNDAKVGLASMLKASKDDVEREAAASAELVNTARDNLQAVIEGILYPVLNAQGYSLRWQ